METALGLARRGLGSVWPNPAVGCVLVRDGRVVGRGWTQPGGRPHAEVEALHRAGEAARGATAYVTLEPCSHYGKTPPCADALIAAGIARAVVAIEDPDPRVSGRGLARMRDAGITVETGLLADAARRLNAGFLLRIGEGRPLFTLKAATSLDGRIATVSGHSQWITGPEARAWGHALRAENDGILIGIGTALADDPALTCRLPGLEERSPVRIVLDGTARLPADSALAATAREIPTWVLVGPGAPDERCRALAERGVMVIEVESGVDGRLSVDSVGRRLADRGLTRVLIEGGGAVAGAWLAAGRVDRLCWFRAAMMIGGDGRAAAEAFGVETLLDAKRFVRIGTKGLGADLFEEYQRSE